MRLRGHRPSSGVALCVLAAGLLSMSCGKKGPPLPPLVKLPAPPADLTAERHGETVDLRFTVPAANTDGTRPANVSRVDIYAVTAPPTVTDEQLLKQGTKLASVSVKAPRNPDQTIDPDEPADDMEAPEGPGVDQGAVAHVSDRLDPAALRPVELKSDTKVPKAAIDDTPRPLLGPPQAVATRTYAVVGISTRSRRGPVSRRVAVPLLDAPQTLAAPSVEYNEKAVTVTWKPAVASTDAGVLPSSPIGVVPPKVSYNVYDVSGPQQVMTRLTATPVAEPPFADTRMVWGERRCYTVRTVLTVGPASIEGDEPAPTCVTLKDTFPPATPKGLNAVPSEGAISLIWEPNTESDLRGYIVLRAVAPADVLTPITTEPITQTTFKDGVEPGIRYVYAVRAVDTAGNVSPISERIEETAR